MRLACTGFSQDQQRASVAALRLFRRGRAFDLLMEQPTSVGVDRFDIEWIALVKLRAMCDRREHLRPVTSAECERARIDSYRRGSRLLEQISQLATRSLLDLGGASGEHCLHHADEHSLVVV